MSKDESLLENPQFPKVLLERLGQTATLVLDSAGGITYVSKRAERLLKQSVEVLHGEAFINSIDLRDEAGEPIFERKHPVWQAMREEDFNQVTPFFCTLGITELSGEITSLPVAIRAIRVQEGSVFKGVVVEMREVKRDLNVGEMKSLFVSFAAHQLKTPSSIVKGFLELMIREGEVAYSHNQWHNLQSAFEANENLIHLSKTLLNLTRLEGGLIEPKIAPFDPLYILHNKVRSHQLLLGVKKIKAQVHAPEQAINFHSDEAFFSEVFEILFSNAIKYSPEGSTIHIHCIINGDDLEVIVKDEGEGIAPEHVEHLFTAATQQDPNYDSHGLGLLMAKKYITLLGGKIGLRDDNDPGATLFFSIPKPLL